MCMSRGRGAGRGHKAASNLCIPESSLGLSPVRELRAGRGWPRLGRPLRIQGGTDGAGPRSQGIAPRGEVELVPTAGRGGWQRLSGPDLLPQQLPTWGRWGGEGGVPKALVLSGDGGPDATCPLAKASWRGS